VTGAFVDGVALSALGLEDLLSYLWIARRSFSERRHLSTVSLLLFLSFFFSLQRTRKSAEKTLELASEREKRLLGINGRLGRDAEISRKHKCGRIFEKRERGVPRAAALLSFFELQKKIRSTQPFFFKHVASF
jgi:hypothetical protein